MYKQKLLFSINGVFLPAVGSTPRVVGCGFENGSYLSRHEHGASPDHMPKAGPHGGRFPYLLSTDFPVIGSIAVFELPMEA